MLLQDYKKKIPATLACLAFLFTLLFAVVAGNILWTTMLIRAIVSGITFAGIGLIVVNVFNSQIEKFVTEFNNIESQEQESSDDTPASELSTNRTEQGEINEELASSQDNTANISPDGTQSEFKPFTSDSFENISIKDSQ